VRPGAVSGRSVFQLVQTCRRLASWLVLDVPCSFDDLQFETLSLADQVVLVGVQTVASVRTLKLVRDALAREEGIQSMRLVINRYEPSLPGFGRERLAELLGVPQVLTVGNDYPSVTAAVNNGKPLALAVPHSPVLADVRALAAALTGTPAPAPSSSGDRLARALGRREPAGPRAVRVLHVEDDPVTQQAIRLHLSAIREFAFQVSSAVSEAEATEAFGRQPFDVVLLDYHLAQGNGLNCLRQLRAIDPMVPVLVISSVAQPHVAAELLAAGADDFLSKENVTGPSLVRSLSAAVARADAIKQRLGDEARLDTFLDRVRRTVGDESELLQSLHEIRQSALQRRFSAGQIQRLADVVCGELDRGTAPGRAAPRKAILGLFMRLFGGQGEQ
jgi:CheY-like chemotaxis protein